jgi:hypothetical protein
MKIGDSSYSPRRPRDLDAQLIASTGLDAADMASLLAGTPLAGHVAQALIPFLPEKDRPDALALAEAIAADGVAGVAAQVRAMYEGEEAPAPTPTPTPTPAPSPKPTDPGA